VVYFWSQRRNLDNEFFKVLSIDKIKERRFSLF
jgi:hypothetical protein